MDADFNNNNFLAPAKTSKENVIKLHHKNNICILIMIAQLAIFLMYSQHICIKTSI